MPARVLTALASTAALAAFLPSQTPTVSQVADGHTLTVVVTGLAARGGSVGVAVFSSAEGFPDGTAPAAALLRPHSTAAADTFVFRNLRPGRYAIAAQHDLNANGKVDRNLFGIPKEPWGVSKDVRHSMRAPRFDEAAFELRQDMGMDVRVAR
jgi:uncharacterized protein (DUF2141 family)